MKLKKLSIQNFKGVHNLHVIEFEKPLCILQGPNGFGKTTIYDAVELCLTGMLHRTMKVGHVTRDIKDYSDAFYRNTKNEDVVLKLLVERNDGSQKVIVRRLAYNDSGLSENVLKGVKNKATNWDNIQAFLLEPEEFENTNYELMDRSDQGSIEEWFFEGERRSLKRLYKLFAYLQQEENTFYLKLSEKERKDELDHLFDTEKEASVLTKLDTRLKALRAIDRQIDGLIGGLGVKDPGENEAQYSKLLPKIDLQFDRQDPFESVDLKNIDEVFAKLSKNLSDIQAFLNDFDVKEYDKSLNKEKLLKLADNQKFLDYIILKKFLDDQAYSLLLKRRNLEMLCKRDSFQKFYILQEFFKKDRVVMTPADTEVYSLYSQYLNGENRPISIEEKLQRTSSWKRGISPEQKQQAADYAKRLVKSNQSLTQTEKAISELKELRVELETALAKATSQHGEKDGKCECPFCGHSWDSYDKLIKAVHVKTQFFADYKSEQAKENNTLREVIINTFLAPLEKSFERYLEENKKRYNFAIFLEKIETGFGSVDYADYAEQLKKAQPRTVSLIWNEAKTGADLKDDLMKLSSIIGANETVDEDVFKRITELRGYTFEKSLEEMGRLGAIRIEGWKDNVGNIEKLQDDITALAQKIYAAANGIKVNTEKLGGTYAHFYKSYFLEDRKVVEEAKSEIKSKVLYLEWKYQQKKYTSFEVLQKRSDKLKRAIDEIDSVRAAYEKVLKQYKAEMIEKIKIPFYIYSAKIIQNYQQGIGVFISSSQTNNGAIRFLTETESDHDVVHHLSSGQLAVVSIAFSLAINKVYGSSSLKLLAIDDPVHELDALNIHSFVELLRHDFIDDYQIIISTHDQQSAKYMEYRFEKFKPNQVQPINVQGLFFKAASK